MRDVIRKHVPVTELLAGMAEEAAELAQAALKLRRVLDGTNPTPVKEEEATEQLYEEVADVTLYLNILGVPISYITGLMEAKQKRWVERLVKHDE